MFFLTLITEFPVEPLCARAVISTDSVCACCPVLTRVFITFIDIWKETKRHCVRCMRFTYLSSYLPLAQFLVICSTSTSSVSWFFNVYAPSHHTRTCVAHNTQFTLFALLSLEAWCTSALITSLSVGACCCILTRTVITLVDIWKVERSGVGVPFIYRFCFFLSFCCTFLFVWLLDCRVDKCNPHILSEHLFTVVETQKHFVLLGAKAGNSYNKSNSLKCVFFFCRFKFFIYCVTCNGLRAWSNYVDLFFNAFVQPWPKMIINNHMDI